MPGSVVGAVAGAAAGKLMDKAFGDDGGGGAGGIVGSGIQYLSAEDAAELYKPYTGLGSSASNAFQHLYFGSPEGKQAALQKYYNSPEFQLGQNAMYQGARNLGFGLSALGKNPVGADGTIRHGAGLNQYLQGVNNIAMQNYGLYAGRLGDFMGTGLQAAGGEANARIGAGSYLGDAAGRAVNLGGQVLGGALGGSFGNYGSMPLGGGLGSVPYSGDPTYGWGGVEGWM